MGNRQNGSNFRIKGPEPIQTEEQAMPTAKQPEGEAQGVGEIELMILFSSKIMISSESKVNHEILNVVLQMHHPEVGILVDYFSFSHRLRLLV